MRTTDYQKALAVVPVQSALERDPFRRLIFDWLDFCRASDLSSRTIHDYQDKVFKFWWWWSEFTRYSEKLGQHPNFVTKREAREYALYLRTRLTMRWGERVKPGREELSDASVKAYWRTIRVFFSWLLKEKEINEDPFSRDKIRISSGRKEDKTVKTVADPDLAKIFRFMMQPERLAAYSGKRDLAMLALLADSGLRRGELLSMTTADLDLNRCRCKVNGKSGPREAFFSGVCREAMYAYLRARMDHRQEDILQLWLTEDSTPLSDNGFSIMITRLSKHSGVRFSAHRLRHSFATTLAAQGVNVFDLRDLLGHSSIATTQIYVNSNSAKLAAAYAPRSPLKNLDLGDVFKRKPGRPRKEGR
jgi:site-specific recombinase XerD